MIVFAWIPLNSFNRVFVAVLIRCFQTKWCLDVDKKLSRGLSWTLYRVRAFRNRELATERKRERGKGGMRDRKVPSQLGANFCVAIHNPRGNIFAVYEISVETNWSENEWEIVKLITVKGKKTKCGQEPIASSNESKINRVQKSTFTVANTSHTVQIFMKMTFDIHGPSWSNWSHFRYILLAFIDTKANSYHDSFCSSVSLLALLALPPLSS